MSMMSDVIVVGGGLHGMSAALYIARRGKRVLVLEKDRIAAHASSYSAGGVRTLGRHPAEIPLAVESIAMWHRIADLVGDDCGFQEVGQVKVAENDAELQTLHKDLRAQIVEQNNSLKRVEDQLGLVREATDRNTLEQQELLVDLKAMGTKVNVVAAVAIGLLAISLMVNLALYMHIQRVLP